MPTPFYHLSVAQDLLEHSGLAHRVRVILHNNRAAFLLGKTAPDVQVISGQTREDTHFYSLPVFELDPAWERMMAAYPALADSGQLPAAQAAFVAGYLCHLQADQCWAIEIFNPGFGLDQKWSTFRRRLYYHNVLRAYLDRQYFSALAADTGAELARLQPESWLPFVKNEHLIAWRDFLAEQLRPGAAVQTVEVFAARQGVAPEEFYRLLESEEMMAQEIFAHLPRRKLEAYRSRVLGENILLLEAYLAGN